MLKYSRTAAIAFLAGFTLLFHSGNMIANEPDYSGLTADNHPRVIYTDDDFTALARIVAEETNPYLTQVHETILRSADECVGAPDLKKKLIGKRILSVSRQALKRILFCTYAYKTTREPQYLTQAQRDLASVCNFEDWNAERHFLDAGEMATAVGLAYDWLYNDLDESTKTLVLRALNDFAFIPAVGGEKPNSFYELKNNWNQVCNGGLVCAALATYEDNPDIARTLVEKAVESNVEAMKASYSPDGNYPEGYMYWDYGTMFETMMLTALKTAVGTDGGLSDIEGFSKTSKFIIHMEGTSGLSFNYSDCAASVGPSIPQLYFAWRFGDLSVMYLEQGRSPELEKEKGLGANRLLPVFAWHASKLNLSDILAPKEHIFHGEGKNPLVLVHDTWTMDKDDMFLGVKGGKAKNSHGHMDAGSFVFDAEGLRWASDLGGENYAPLEAKLGDIWRMADDSDRWKVFRYVNQNHNTLTVNDAHHKVNGFADIIDVIDTRLRRGATIDLTKPLAGEVARAVRTVYIEDEDLVVEDKITALDNKAAKVRWTLVTPAEPVIENGAVTLSQAGRKRYLTCDSADGHVITWHIWSAQSENEWDSPNPGMSECGYTLTVFPGETVSVKVRLTPD